MIRVDLHLHTRFSSDASTTPKHVIDALNAHPTVKGVAITDHDSLKGYFEVRKLAAAFEDLVIIPGVEVSTNKGDIILLGIEERPPYGSTLDSVIDFALKRSALVLIPHPYRVHGIGDAANGIRADAVEIMNPWSTLGENKLAQKLAEARNLPGVAGSDAHKPEQMWKAYTEVTSGPDVESILNAIRGGRVKPIQ